MSKLLTFLTTLALGPLSGASLLETVPSGRELEGVKLAGNAQVTADGSPQKLKEFSSGLRIKKIAFIKVKVYVAEWFIAEGKTWNKTMADLKNVGPVAMRATFLRDVESEKIEGAFRESFKVNKIAVDEPAIKSFLNLVIDGGEIKKGQVFTLLGKFAPDGSETLVYESASGKVSEIKGPAGFLQQVYAIWFGDVAEDSLQDLKKALLNP